MKDYLFVCGTLMSEYVEGEIVEVTRRLRSLGPASVRGRLHNLGAFPGAVVDSAATTSIHGELLELPNDKSTLETLDLYENFDPSRPEKSLFVRRRTNITSKDGETVQGWIYAYNGETTNAPLIDSGKWSKPRHHSFP